MHDAPFATRQSLLASRDVRLTRIGRPMPINQAVTARFRRTYSTVTDLAKLRGLSTSYPFILAISMASS